MPSQGAGRPLSNCGVGLVAHRSTYYCALKVTPLHRRRSGSLSRRRDDHPLCGSEVVTVTFAVGFDDSD